MQSSNAEVRRIHDPPPAVAEFAVEAGGEPDYWDRFAIDVGPTPPPARDWARLALRGADGAFAQLVWHGLLGLELAPREQPGTLLGWRISRDSDEAFAIDAEGGRMAGRMAFELSDGSLGWTTMLRYRSPLARPIWALAGNAHRAVAPRALGGAAAAVARTPDRAAAPVA